MSRRLRSQEKMFLFLLFTFCVFELSFPNIYDSRTNVPEMLITRLQAFAFWIAALVSARQGQLPTTTSFLPASSEAFICKAGSCAYNVVASSIRGIPPAITTNDPKDKVPSITNYPYHPGKRSSRVTRVGTVKRVDEEDPTIIRQRDFTDPNTFLTGTKAQWFQHAVGLVESSGPQRIETPTGGIPSSTWFDYSDLRNHAITTGTGPSWGCTSVLVFSERGVWMAHFWEQEQIQNSTTFDSDVLNFLRIGSGDGIHQGLVDVVDWLFNGSIPEDIGESLEEPLFSAAVIFTPSYRDSQKVPEGAKAADPIYGDQIKKIKALLIDQLPAFTDQNIQVATYKPVNSAAEMEAQPWLGLMTFEYAPQHLRKTDDGQCIVSRALRIWNQDEILGVYPYTWPQSLPTASGLPDIQLRSKQVDIGACPADVSGILKSQGNGAYEPQFVFGLNAPATTIPTSTTASTIQPTPPPTLPDSDYMCSSWQLSPNGVQVGSDCGGDPNKVVTVTVSW
ncbi:uncharacterized protein LY89DRAFT_786877 [Mollisia scopiformis]|uniref:Uncharacterized protein n=1 Tax=Mollisia scopiformis TaxID=149040 RepID=A0A194WTI2_MOLSC|nr:uncharacterized protein LY89DRAFT_786877 [Mollisia scopiformis]KUJ11260.1 hypothetical protein LY89DRAFT_786877 [Mollisia scopiformis]